MPPFLPTGGQPKTLNASTEPLRFTLEPFEAQRFANLCGQLDEHLRLIEQRMALQIRNRGNQFEILGDSVRAQACQQLIQRLYRETQATELSPELIHLYLQESALADLAEDKADPSIALKTRKGMIRPRGANQQRYVKSILEHDINFGIGPAGTGKTYPYLRPLYDALYEMLGFEQVAKLIERQVIEVAPLAYMRGRTLNNSYIILDEAQNTTPEQMKMFLTRIGFGAKAVVTGDVTQIDLQRGQKSGLIEARQILREVRGIAFTEFQKEDVVRHPLVARIVSAYEAHTAALEAQLNDK